MSLRLRIGIAVVIALALGWWAAAVPPGEVTVLFPDEAGIMTLTFHAGDHRTTYIKGRWGWTPKDGFLRSEGPSRVPSFLDVAVHKDELERKAWFLAKRMNLVMALLCRLAPGRKLTLAKKDFGRYGLAQPRAVIVVTSGTKGPGEEIHLGTRAGTAGAVYFWLPRRKVGGTIAWILLDQARQLAKRNLDVDRRKGR